MALVYWNQNDNLLELDGLTNARTGSYVTTGVITVTVQDASGGSEISGQTWPTSFAATGSSGDWIATLEDGMIVTAGQKLVALVTASAASLKGYWEADVIVRTRKA